jgi:predicted AAA+ superfamily ATPase
LLETFVFSEVLKQASWFGESCALYHYRDKDQDEVDRVIETGSSALVGIEVKASATVNAGDFKGLRKLAEACGDNFKLGVVLYDSGKPVPFGERLVAAPISRLWGCLDFRDLRAQDEGAIRSENAIDPLWAAATY